MHDAEQSSTVVGYIIPRTLSSRCPCLGALSVHLPPAEALSSIPRAPKALKASRGCDLIRRSICPAVHAPSITDAHYEPSRQKRVDQHKVYNPGPPLTQDVVSCHTGNGLSLCGCLYGLSVC